jgi:hypothetical protein
MKGNMRTIALFLGLILFGFGAAGVSEVAAQEQASGGQPVIYQLSGMVLGPKNGEPIAYASISINKENRGGFTNETGFFSLPVTARDTLYFNRLGYKETSVAVQQLIEENKPQNRYLYTVQFLEEDTMRTEPVEVYPYNDPHEIKMALINMPTPTEADIEAAESSLSMMPTDIYERGRNKQAMGAQAMARQQFYRSYGVRNTRPYATLIDPAQIVRLIQYMGEKSKEKQEKVYNYWPDE